jgi:TolB-like protein/DNA-binding winged helix-turn-helix (wHTH) protein/tetratricopeptide (TPR) repeat protein
MQEAGKTLKKAENQVNRPGRLVYEFGPFRADPHKRVLFRDGECVPLTGKAFEMLLAFLESHGALLTRDELTARIWPDTAVEESNLWHNLSTLRKALGEDPDDHRYIVTQARQGYRFVAEVCERREDGAPAAGPSLVVPERRTATWMAWSRAGSRRWLWVGSLLAVIVGAAAVVVWRVQPAMQSAIVLPFANLTGDPGYDYLADGITEGLTDALAQVASLRVVARTSAFQFKNKALDIREIGRQADAQIAIEGSLRTIGNRLRITVQANRTRDGYHIFSKTFDGTARELSGVDSALAAPLLAVLHPGQHLPPEHAPDAEAWKLLLRARTLRGYSTPDNFSREVTLLNQAIQQDAQYARAYSELAAAYAGTSTNGFVLPLDAAASARTAAARAIQLDPNSALAYAAEGYVDAMVLTNWNRGEDELRTALRLMPQDAACHHWLSLVLLVQGKFEPALEEARAAAHLDPLVPATGIAIGMVYFFQRRYDDALAHWQNLAKLHPDALMIHHAIGWAWEAKGEYDKASHEFNLVAARYPDFMQEEFLLLAALSGRKQEARTGLRKLERTAPDHYFAFAIVEGHLGDRDQAFAWLERAWQQRTCWMLKVHPFLDPLRGDPRYAALLKRAGLGS